MGGRKRDGDLTGAFTDQRVTIIGLAREGTALAQFLVEQGATVTASDLRSAEALADSLVALEGLPIRFVLGSHPEHILEVDTLFVSPGVPLEAPIVAEARRRGVPISSETQLFTRLCPAPIVGITGSSGKTTTTALVGEMMKVSGFRTWVGGNIGQPLIGYLSQIEPGDRVVMELSSFQLEIMRWSPPIAAILNITPNHLDRHLSMEAYIAAKENILRYQGASDVAVLGYDNPVTRDLAERCRGRVLFFSQHHPVVEGACLWDERIIVRLTGQEWDVCATDDIRLLGGHNVDNVLAACALAAAAGAGAEALASAVTSFTGVAHRLELVRELNGVRYYNDSIATTPERTVAALRSFDAPIILLAGGRDKHLPWQEMAELTLRRVRHLVLFGEAAPIIERAVTQSRKDLPPSATTMEGVQRVTTLEEAMTVAARLARPGDVVLLAPGGTSFDAFRDFAERGERFRKLVEAL